MKAESKRRILIVSLLIAVAIGAFAFGFHLGRALERVRMEAWMKIASIGTQNVQKAADELQETFPDAIPKLRRMTNEADISKSITFALFGTNQLLNPSNLVFLQMPDGAIENGVLRNKYVKRFTFRLVWQPNNSTTDSTLKISVSSEGAFNPD